MTTTQESPNGHRVPPPPVSLENPAQPNSADLPANQDNLNQFASDDQVVERQKDVDITSLLAHEKVDPREQDRAPAPAAGAYHVPPKHFAPRPNAYAYDDSFHRPPETGPLPDRCQFMFSDGRQCTMARSDIHPSLCVYHSDREEQLFGDPSHRCETRKLDFPELFSACRNLSTAAGVNRALAQVFRLLAQRRISRQEAATFAKLGHLLLQSIRAARTELAAAAESDDVSGGVILSEQPGSPTRAVFGRAGVGERSAQFASRSTLREISPQPPPERDTSSPTSPRSQPLRPSKNQPEPPPGAFVMKSNPEQGASSIFSRAATPVLNEEERFVLSGCACSEAFTAQNPRFAELPQNQHLQNLGTSSHSKSALTEKQVSP